MILSDTAKRRAVEYGERENIVNSIASTAYKQRSRVALSGIAGKFVASIRRQHGYADVRVRAGFVFVFNGEVLTTFYRMPEIVEEKTRRG